MRHAHLIAFVASLACLAGCAHAPLAPLADPAAPDTLAARATPVKLATQIQLGQRHFFDYADRDHDGRLSRDEAATINLYAAPFDKMDRNGDGWLAFAELMNGVGVEDAVGSILELAPKLVKIYDRDGDHRVSEPEFMRNDDFQVLVFPHHAGQTPQDVKRAAFVRAAGSDRVMGSSEASDMMGNLLEDGYGFAARVPANPPELPIASESVMSPLGFSQRGERKATRPPTRVSAEAEIKRFVHAWFAAFERRAPGAELAPFLDPQVTFNFPDRMIAGIERFVLWYDGLQPGIASWKFTVHSVAVSPAEDGRYNVVLRLRREVVTTAGERVPFEAVETWVVAQRPTGDLAIVSYREVAAPSTPAEPKP